MSWMIRRARYCPVGQPARSPKVEINARALIPQLATLNYEIVTISIRHEVQRVYCPDFEIILCTSLRPTPKTIPCTLDEIEAGHRAHSAWLQGRIKRALRSSPFSKPEPAVRIASISACATASRCSETLLRHVASISPALRSGSPGIKRRVGPILTGDANRLAHKVFIVLQRHQRNALTCSTCPASSLL